MEQKITDIIMHMGHSHQQLARIIDAERHITVRLSQIVHALPDQEPNFEGVEGLMDNSSSINKSLISYLNSIADLEEAMAENLSQVIAELKGSEEE
ncbi:MULTISPECIES: nucleoside-diphosphate sugar epimerase [Paenibacillus]|uniref:Nucleoside-diphosphate sugar epimerase n=1 Tax=Paenibacillus vini TaxID=1476024 RepID=A0ABQ4MGE6_9BACL|nr:nucleoside-diphosphate sugar epimerase [Paenibacillus vini]MBQ4900651.1 nucleoside-diphosphate sugar epimerase [Paenibacillus sp. Marseille-P2973]MDN4067892.1 nucleoside-diphosphate sugar epimerase [Paenibacillus vini]GIP55071.1 hypothetical protein J42TS3_41060 [Paenibacillus vini]